MQMETGSATGRSLGPVPAMGRRLQASAADDAEFAAMRSAYHATGGFARGDDLARVLEDFGRGNLATLGRMVVAGEVFGFEWRHTLWIPMFQFTAGHGAQARAEGGARRAELGVRRPAPRRVVRRAEWLAR